MLIAYIVFVIIHLISGHCTMIGKNTGKCVRYSVKSKHCSVCSFARRNGKIPRVHDCRVNWHGSSKAMEPAMVCEMMSELKKEGANVKVLQGDEDTTTIARARKIDSEIVKKSDKNHIRKCLTSDLYNLKKMHHNFSEKCIAHVKKCFNYALEQNRGNVDAMKKALGSITPHCFGDHSCCSSSWCRANSPDYKHKSLPHGKPLQGETLKSDMQKIFLKYILNADSLVDIGSTQANENLNFMISSKAPKSKHYGGTSSLNYRVGAAICQKNIGHTYVSEVCFFISYVFFIYYHLKLICI